MQRVPVLLTLEPQPLDGAVLRAGMTVTVSIDTGHSRGLPRPLRALVENLR